MGHLYLRSYQAIAVLEPVHEQLLKGELDGALVRAQLEAADPDLVSIWDDYLAKYYQYTSTRPELHSLYEANALVYKALLFHRPLEDRDLPLHEHERDTGCVRQCCLTMLMCDNSEAPY